MEKGSPASEQDLEDYIRHSFKSCPLIADSGRPRGTDGKN